MDFKSQISNFKFIFWWLRQVLGDSAYENYLRSARRATVGADLRVCPPEADTLVRPYSPTEHAGTRHAAPVVAPKWRDHGVRELAPALPSAQLAAPVSILSREEFFLDSLRRRYSSISRCC